jgi:hypothetical protein
LIWNAIPNDVIAWFRNAFAEANRKVSEMLLNAPNIRETSLDDAFVMALVPRSAPTRLGSGALVRMDIHNIGGLRRLHHWEVADIGIVVFVSRANKIIAQKLALLQSKRLYPHNNSVDDEDPGGFLYGLNAMLLIDRSRVSMALARRFDFQSDCVYGSIKAHSQQVNTIESFSRQWRHPIGYLLYNPPKMPVSISYPLSKVQVRRRPPSAGTRVVPAPTVHSLLSQLPKGSAPTYGQIKRHAGGEYWRVEFWAADLLLTCKAGLEFDAADSDMVLSVITRRSGPIGAAIAVHIELPAE